MSWLRTQMTVLSHFNRFPYNVSSTSFGETVIHPARNNLVEESYQHKLNVFINSCQSKVVALAKVKSVQVRYESPINY